MKQTQLHHHLSKDALKLTDLIAGLALLQAATLLREKESADFKAAMASFGVQDFR